LENHLSHNELWSNFCLKKWEELIYCGKSWNIGQFECLMFMNFVALIYCVKHALLSFLNEAVLKFAKLPCLISEWKVKCKGEQIHLKIELKLLDNSNLFCFINYIKTRTILYRKSSL
jgi:hypothetical protein